MRNYILLLLLYSLYYTYNMVYIIELNYIWEKRHRTRMCCYECVTANFTLSRRICVAPLIKKLEWIDLL